MDHLVMQYRMREFDAWLMQYQEREYIFELHRIKALLYVMARRLRKDILRVLSVFLVPKFRDTVPFQILNDDLDDEMPALQGRNFEDAWLPEPETFGYGAFDELPSLWE
jgi:hypothetical protein